jgi:hypothetical protein
MNRKNKNGYVAIGVIAVLILAYLMLNSNTLSFAGTNGLLPAPTLTVVPSMINGTILPLPPLYNAFALSGVENNNLSYVGTPLSASFDIPISSANVTSQSGNTAVNTQCETFVFDNTTSQIVQNTAVQTVSTTSYSSSETYTPSATGVYVFGAVCQTATTSFNIANNTWSAWSVPKIGGQKELFATKVVEPATPPPPPQFNLSQFISQIVTDITSFLSSLGI